MDYSLLALCIIIGGIFFARHLNQLGMRALDAEQIAEYTRVFQRRSTITIIVLLSVLGAYYLIMTNEIVSEQNGMILFFSIVLIIIGIQTHTAHRSFTALGFPQKTIQYYIYSALIRIISLVAYGLIITNN